MYVPHKNCPFFKHYDTRHTLVYTHIDTLHNRSTVEHIIRHKSGKHQLEIIRDQ